MGRRPVNEGERAEAVGQLLRDAIAEKDKREGGHYRLIDLQRDSGVELSYASRVVRGQRYPSRDVLMAIGHALRPYVDPDELLVAAGYLTDKLAQIEYLRRVLHLTPDQVRDALEYVGRRVSRPVEKPQPDRAHTDTQDDARGKDGHHDGP